MILIVDCYLISSPYFVYAATNFGPNNHHHYPANPQKKFPSKTKECNMETFQIYDGYELIWSNDNDTSGGDSFATPDNLLQTITFKETNLYHCLKLCKENYECKAINFNKIRCQMIISTTTKQDKYPVRTTKTEAKLIISNETSGWINLYAEKICITDLYNNCNGRPWSFESIIGYYINYPSYSSSSIGFLKPNQQPGLMNHTTEHSHTRKQHIKSAIECIEACLNELSFTCRSAIYNRIKQECTLNDMNRQTIRGGNIYIDRFNNSNETWTRNFGTSSDSATIGHSEIRFIPTFPFSNDVIYLENKCIKEPKSFCEFKAIKQHRLKSADLIWPNINSIEECRQLCLSDVDARPCKSFHYDHLSEQCQLSHLSESSTVHLKVEPYSHDDQATTYELSTCYNVSVICQSKMMKIQIETNKLFNGKVYTPSQPKNCLNDVVNQLNFDLSIPYVSSNNKNNDSDQACGTRQSVSGQFSNDIIIQHHDLVLTTKDLALGVFCKFDLLNSSIAQIDLKLHGDISTEKLKATAKLPELSLHIVDENGQDINEVSVGDILRVQIRMSDEDTYGIFVRNLIAKDKYNPNYNFTLIDSKGCPVQMRMMREVRLLNETGKITKTLESYLEAFAFTGGSLLIIQVEVETCLDKCKPVQCQVANARSFPGLETVSSYGRRRRRSTSSSMIDIDQATTGDIISMTKLTKSLLVRQEQNSIETELNHKLKFNQSKSSKAFIQKIDIDEIKYWCFDPTNLFWLCGSFCGLQITMFSLVFYAIMRLKNTNRIRHQRPPSSLDFRNPYQNPSTSYDTFIN